MGTGEVAGVVNLGGTGWCVGGVSSEPVVRYCFIMYPAAPCPSVLCPPPGVHVVRLVLLPAPRH